MENDTMLRYLIRPGPVDHVVLDRLLTPSPLQPRPISLDGVVLDASHAQRFDDVRRKMPGFCQILVDHQTYRLQDPSCQEIASLKNLPYSPEKGAYTPQHFHTSADVSRFVTQVIEFQHNLRVTDYLAPAFFWDSQDSSWQDVNDRLLRETIRQVGLQVYAMLCGSHSALCKGRVGDVSFRLANSGVIGVQVLVSPLAAVRDSPSKLEAYVELLRSLRDNGLRVIAARQPAFGLGLHSLGIAGFDSGIAQAEQFNLPSLFRPRVPTRGKKGGRKSRGVYVANLMSNVQPHVAERLFSTRGLAGSYVCREVCCRDGSAHALSDNREHFVYSRLKEVEVIRDLPKDWRVHHYTERLVSAHQLAQKAAAALPDLDLSPRFTHLDHWLRVVTVCQGASQRT